MKESSFNHDLAIRIQEEIGGRVRKISDKVALGLPDTEHVKDSIVSYFEVKLYKHFMEKNVIQPWKAVNDIRQFEVCKRMSKSSLVFYVIYCPKVKMTAVLHLSEMETFRPVTGVYTHLNEGFSFMRGFGIERIKWLMTQNRKEIYEKLKHEF